MPTKVKKPKRRVTKEKLLKDYMMGFYEDQLEWMRQVAAELAPDGGKPIALTELNRMFVDKARATDRDTLIRELKEARIKLQLGTVQKQKAQLQEAEDSLLQQLSSIDGRPHRERNGRQETTKGEKVSA